MIKTFRQLTNYSKDILCNLMMSDYHSFNKILDTDDVNRQVNIFIYLFNLLMFGYRNSYCNKKKSPYAPWFNDGLRNAIEKKDAIHNDLKRDRANTLLLEQ